MAILLRFPFDWKNPLGYSIAIAVQYITAAYGLLFLASLVIFGMVTFFFANALIKDINGLLQTINKNAKVKKNRDRILKQLLEFIQYHSDVKQLCNHTFVCSP